MRGVASRRAARQRRRSLVLLVVGLSLTVSLGPPVPTVAAADPVLIAAGDIAGCTWTADSATAALLDRIPGTIATLGDNAYPDGTARQFRDCYGPTWGRHLARTRPSAGNHDHHTDGAAGYFDYFGSRAGPAGRGWYSYALGSWHIVVLDSNCAAVGGCSTSSAQYAWLRADLAAHRDDDVLAYWHHPRFSSGTHGPTRAMGPFWELLYAEGADIVLNGHEHDYERFAPQDPWARADPDHGIRQFVVGTGGAALRGRATTAANSQAFGRSHGVLRLTLREGSYDWSFEPVAGATFRDAGSGSTHGPPRQTRGRTVVTTAADTFVDQAQPSTAYGSSPVLWTDGDSGSGSDRWTYLRFTVPALPGAIHRAVLRLWVTNGSADGPRLVPTATSWSNAMTWAGRPAATGPPVVDTARIDAGTWLTIEVTALLRGPGSVAFALVPTSGDGLGLSSREGPHGPKLTLETLPGWARRLTLPLPATRLRYRSHHTQPRSSCWPDPRQSCAPPPPAPGGAMDHEPVLITTIAIGLSAAFVGGLLARRLRLPAIVGYIAAGVAIGPFTPGFIADAAIATELAELGVILLMFGVGIHFSIRDLLAVKSIAVPGAIGQILVATLLGVGLGVALGWGIGGGLVLGLAVSVASTVVLLRALMDRGDLDTAQGRIAVGWLIVEDLFTVVVLVLLPSIAPLLGGSGGEAATGLGPVGAVALALGKAAIFAALMIVAGARVVPWVLHQVARDGSRELFTLAVLAIALGIAYLSYSVFGVSFALGAFLAGAVVGESDMSHQAAQDALPLRDAFAVLFFVSVGMLLDPAFLLAQPLAILAVLLLVVAAKALAAFAIVALAGYPVRVGLTVAAGLAQIGEFSFILGTVGLTLGLLPPDGFQLIVAGALLSITVNPFLFRAIDPLEMRLRRVGSLRRLTERRAGDLARLDHDTTTSLQGHAVIAGYGRVGRLIAPALERRGFRYVVVTQQREEVDALRAAGVTAVFGDATSPEVLELVHLDRARVLVIASTDVHEARLIVEHARLVRPDLDVIVRTHSDTEAAHLRGLGPKVQPIHGDRELAVQMARYTLRRFGVSAIEAEAIAQGLRDRARGASAPG